MRLVAHLALAWFIVEGDAASASRFGVRCGEKQCAVDEYCSPYDTHCKPCSEICKTTGYDDASEDCITHCHGYLTDKRYVLLDRYEGEIGKLRTLTAISIAVAILSLLTTLYLLVRSIGRWEKVRRAFRRTFTAAWKKKKADVANSSTGNNNNNNANRNRIQKNDAEAGTAKSSGLKLAMPTISASVAPSRVGSGNESATGSGSSSGNGLSSSTPNTTSTSLSRRHPSEDTTLDYAYDNPAMTPSPEAAQLRTKRENSF